jgi:hypothetical protein
LKIIIEKSSFNNSAHIQNGKTIEIKSATILLLQILFFLSFIFLYSENNYTEINYLVSFDGIDYFVRKNKYIKEEAITTIWDTICSAFSSIQGFINEDTNISIKYIFVARNTTINMINSESVEDIEDEKKIKADVTNIYNFYKGFLNKKKILDDYLNFASKESVTDHNKRHIEIVNQVLSSKALVDGLCDIILKDSNAGHGIMTFLSEMFNGDCRKISDNLFISIDNFIRYSGKNLKDVCDKFIELWTVKKKDIKTDNTDLYNKLPDYPFMFLCRRSIIRVFFNRINAYNVGQNESMSIRLFEALYFSTVDEGNYESLPLTIESTMVRRFLIFLINYNSNDDYIGLGEIVRYLLLNNKNGSSYKYTESELIKLADIIFYLSNVKLLVEDSPWNALIEIRYVKGNAESIADVSRDFFLNEIKRHLYNKGDIKSAIAIKINSAGKFLAYFQNDYEFFATRLFNNSKNPLIFVDDIDEVKLIVERIYLRACECSKKVLEYEYNRFENYSTMFNDVGKYYLYMENGKQKTPHIIRVLENHHSYLEHMEYLYRYNPNDKLTPEDNEEIIRYINNYMVNYENLMRALYLGNGDATDFSGCQYLKSKDCNDISDSYLAAYLRNLPCDALREKFKRRWHLS